MDDLQLPASFVRLIVAISEGGWPHFVLKGKVDAYGDYFDNDLEVMLTRDAPESVRRMSHLGLARFLRETNPSPMAEQLQEAGDPSASKPGFIPAVTDFTRIIFFGRNSFARGREISRCCFDYRSSRSQPSVICWQNSYWRRIAPDFSTFLGLYKLAPNRFRESDVGYWEMEQARIERTAKALSRM